MKEMETKLLLVMTVLLAILVPEPAKSSRDEDLPAAMVRSRFGGWVGEKQLITYKAPINIFGRMKK